MTKWKYGNAWEQFPIEEGEVWGLDNGSRVSVHNIFNPLPEFMYQADLLFVDPPWNLSNLNCFYTKAGRDDYIEDFSEFESILFERVKDIAPQVCYLEVGKQAVDRWHNVLSEQYETVQKWNVVYYRKHPCYILRASQHAINELDIAGMDESDVIYKIAQVEKYNTIGDMCMGLGLVGLAAYRAGKPFVGTEINKRRLANLLQGLDKHGAEVKRYE